jgi:prophage regulatory protein
MNALLQLTKLTIPTSENMLTPLSTHLKVEIRTSFIQGDKTPLLPVVFLCPSKTQNGLIRFKHLVMVGCIRQLFIKLVAPWCDSSNLIQSATQRFEPKEGGYFTPNQGETAMTTQEHATKPFQAPIETPLNTLIKLSRVQEITALSHTSVYRKIQENTFPKPIKLGLRASGWVEKEVYNWVETQKPFQFSIKTHLNTLNKQYERLGEAITLLTAGVDADSLNFIIEDAQTIIRKVEIIKNQIAGGKA